MNSGEQLDDILDRINYAKEAELRIYLGGSPGVGKTYRMLQDGNTLAKNGIDVVVGFVETHGRADTAAQIRELEVLPRKQIDYRGRTFEEMDTAAIIARKPQLVLVDELAHTNIPGSKHKKRYNDIEDLLSAGIAVFSTCNVQHLESVHDTVERMTGVEVRERVPDTFFNLAREVIMVDVSADELRERLRAGKIYRPEKIEQSLNHFFTHANISMLREMALREVANDLEQKDKEQRKIGGQNTTSEKALVAIDDSAESRSLIRYGSRMAGRINAKWFVAHVQRPNVRRIAEREAVLTENLKLAKQLGARVVELRGQTIADTLLRFAQEEGITHLLVGTPKKRWWQRIFSPSIVSTLMRSNDEIAVHIFPLRKDDEPAKAAIEGFILSKYLPAEHILAGMHSLSSVEQAIAVLLDHLITLYPELSTERTQLAESIMTRERLMSTVLETGIAIPHAAGIESITELRAAMALVPQGVISLSRDRMAYIVLLFISPEVGRTDHLKFLAAVASMFLDATTAREIAATTTADEAHQQMERLERTRES